MADLRKRRTAAGLRRLELWVAPAQHEAVKKFALSLKSSRQRKETK